MSLRTTTGGTWNTEKPAYSNIITHINMHGRKVRSELYIVKAIGKHTEFGEPKTDLQVIDQFGDTHEVCEDFIYQ